MLITKNSRDIHHFSPDFFRPDGRVIFDGFAEARRFAAQFSAQRSQPAPASDLYALSLIDEALRTLVHRFVPPPVMNTAVSTVSGQVGSDSIASTQQKFTAAFPPEAVYRGEIKVDEYLEKLTGGRIRTIEELIYVFTHNANPAVQPLIELVDDEPLEPTAYKNLIAALDAFFAQLAKENSELRGSNE